MKKLSLILIAFAIFNTIQGQTTPKRTQSDSSKRANSRSTDSLHRSRRQYSLQSPKGYYKQPKDVRGKDSSKIGTTPK
jgi:hypothetical protein